MEVVAGHTCRLGSLLRPGSAVVACGLVGVDRGPDGRRAGVRSCSSRRFPRRRRLLQRTLATAPLLLVRRWPFAVLSTVAAADAVFIVYARLPWPPTAVVTWLLALALSPLLLPRVQAIAVLVASEAAVLAAVFVPLSVNPDRGMRPSPRRSPRWWSGVTGRPCARGRRQTAPHSGCRAGTRPAGA